MPLLPVVLNTDVLIWLLVGAVIVYVWYCRRHDHIAAPWRKVFRSRIAAASAVVLLVFIAIGLADSLHFRPQLPRPSVDTPRAYSNEVLSLLDLALSHLRAMRERTYSTPLATRLYAKEQVDLGEGKQTRDFPRLQYGGSHLEDEGSYAADIAFHAAAGVLGGVLLLLAAVAICGPLARRQPEIPWAAAAWAFGAICVVGGVVGALSLGYHVLGTDKVGQDVLYQSLKSIRTSLVIGILATLAMLPFGIFFGVVAGYFKGWVDDAIQYIYTTLNSIPSVLLIAAAVLIMQVYIDTHQEQFQTAAERADFRLLWLCVILGVTTWTGLTRLLRGETLKLSELDYIQAAHAFGVSNARILSRHILPNVAHIVIIVMVMDFSGLVLAEAVLSYVGVGVDPSMISFGNMINAARLEMSREPIVWWSLAAAFVFMLVMVLAANLFADAVRDGFDPRVRV